jgi:hypothetical protein
MTVLTVSRHVADTRPAGLRGAELIERCLGDPEDPGNPAGHRAIQRAGRRGVTPAGVGLALRGARFAERLVPVGLGGALAGVDALARAVRPVFRRDVGAGMALGAVPFSGALPVWTAGSKEQQVRLADLLLSGRGISAHHDPRSIRDAFAPRGLRVRRTGGGFVLDGECAGLRGSSWPDAVVLQTDVEARHGRPGGPTVLLADLAELPRDRYTVLPGHRIAFDRARLPHDSVVGEAGEGARLFLRTLQISGSALSSMSLGAADACLRIAAERAARGTGGTRRALGSRTAAAITGGAFLDLLICDCLALAGTRAAAVLPHETSVLSAVVRSVVPMLLGDSLRDLAALLGPQSLSLDGTDPVFARHTRQLAGLADGAFIGRAALLPQLPFLARHAWFAGERADGVLFDPAPDTAAFEPDRVTLLNRSDGVAAVLADEDLAGRIGADHAFLPPLLTVLRDELAGVRRHFAAVPDGDRALVTDPRSLAMADRYMLVLTAAACLGCYERLRRSGGGFLAEPAWITAALTRIVHRLGIPVAAPPGEHTEAVRRELARRLAARRGFDLYESPLEG